MSADSGHAPSSLPVPAGGGPYRSSSLPAATLAAAAGALAGAALYVALETAGSTVGGASRGLVAIAAAIALLSIVPAVAGAAAGWVAVWIAIRTDVVNRRLLLAMTVASVAIAAVIVVFTRRMMLGSQAFNHWTDFAKMATLLVVGAIGAYAVVQSEAGEEPVCPTCSRFFKRRKGGQRSPTETQALIQSVRARDLPGLRVEFLKAPASVGASCVYLELWWCANCRALGAMEVWRAEEVTKKTADGASTSIRRRRLHSTKLEGDELTPFL